MILYRQLDTIFLNRKSMSHDLLKHDLESCAKKSEDSECVNQLYQFESRKAVLERLIIDAVDRSMKLDYCLQLVEEIESYGFSSVIQRVTIVGEVVRYAFRCQLGDHVATIVSSLEDEIDEYVEELSAMRKSLR